MRRLVVLSIVVLGLSGSAPAITQNSDQLNPGKWRITIDLAADTANGKPLDKPHTGHQEQLSCLTSATSSPETALVKEGLPEECQIYQVHVAAGKISFTAICPTDEDGVSIDMSAAGTYTSNNMALQIDARAESDGNQANMSGTMLARRVGVCQAKK